MRQGENTNQDISMMPSEQNHYLSNIKYLLTTRKSRMAR